MIINGLGISANYTHIETSALKKAADSMPDITESKGG